MTTKKNLNKEFGESMDLGIKNLVDNHKFHKATNHVEFDTSKLEMPEGVTLESIGVVSDYINNLALQAESATSQIARTLHGDNKDLTTLDSTLKLGNALDINSTHHLRQQVGEEFIYGGHTTAVDFHHSQVQADWLSSNRAADQDLAAKLFG
jgi:hypothetical protein